MRNFGGFLLHASPDTALFSSVYCFYLAFTTLKFVRMKFSVGGNTLVIVLQPRQPRHQAVVDLLPPAAACHAA